MKFVIVLVAMFSISANAILSKISMKTGNNVLETPAEKYKKVVEQIDSLGESSIHHRQVAALGGGVEMLKEHLPQWALAIPLSILAYVWLETGAEEISVRYLRLGMFVRDMYADYTINHDRFFTAETEDDLKWTDETRHFIVGLCFAEAFTAAHNNKESSKFQLEIASWALNQLGLAGKEYDFSLALINFTLAMDKYAEQHEKELCDNEDTKNKFILFNENRIKFSALIYPQIVNLVAHRDRMNRHTDNSYIK